MDSAVVDTSSVSYPSTRAKAVVTETLPVNFMVLFSASAVFWTISTPSCPAMAALKNSAAAASAFVDEPLT